MKCWHCEAEVIWGGDHSFEDYGHEGEGIVTNLSCAHCEAQYLCFLDLTPEEHNSASANDVEPNKEEKL
jgi:hypothetical protein